MCLYCPLNITSYIQEPGGEIYGLVTPETYVLYKVIPWKLQLGELHQNEYIGANQSRFLKPEVYQSQIASKRLKTPGHTLCPNLLETGQ